MGYFSESAQSSLGKWVSGSLGVTRTGGGVFSFQNPEDRAIIVDQVLLDVTTAATSGTCTIDIGYTATSGTTSADNLIDGMDPSSTARVYNHIKDAGTSGVGAARAAKGKWITASQKTGDVTGLAGKFYLHYRKIRT